MARYTTNRRIIRGTSGGFDWARERSFDMFTGRWVCQGDGSKIFLERRTRNLKDGTPDTGWYLYTDTVFGEFCGRRILEAIDVANQMIQN